MIVSGGSVTSHENEVTRFDAPAIVLFAHVVLDGKYFSEIKMGNMLRYYGGEWKDYRVHKIVISQALEPTSTTTHLVIEGLTYSPTQINNMFFGDPEALVLMTCIRKENNWSWGRLFIVAYPN